MCFAVSIGSSSEYDRGWDGSAGAALRGTCGTGNGQKVINGVRTLDPENKNTRNSLEHGRKNGVMTVCRKETV